MGSFCSDCGGHLEKVPDKYLKEGTIWYKCSRCDCEWEYNYGGILPFHDGPKIKRLGRSEERI